MSLSTIPGSWSAHLNARLGPFQHNGNLFVVTRDGTSGAYVYKSTDDGGTWSVASSQLTHGTMQSLDVVQEGNTLHVASVGSGAFKVTPFDLDTETWGSSTGEVTTYVNVSGTYPAFPSVRANGDYVVFHQGNPSGGRRVAYSIWNGLSWSTTAIAPVGDHQDVLSAVNVGDRVHATSNAFLTGDPVWVSNRIYTLSASDNVVSGTGVSGTATYREGEPYRDVMIASPEGRLYAARHFDTESSRTQSIMSADGINGGWAYVNGYLNVEATTSNPVALVHTGFALHQFRVEASTGNILYTTEDDWSTETPHVFATADTRGISASSLDGGATLGVVYDDAGTIRYDRMEILLLLEGEYLWSVSTKESTGAIGPYAEDRRVTIALPSPLAPTLLQPPDNSSFRPPRNPFTWEFNPNPETPTDTQQEFAFRRDGDGAWDEIVSGTPTLGGNGRGVAYSPDGAHIAVANLTNAPYLRIVRTLDWAVVSGVPAMPGSCYSVAFSPDGSRLVVGHANSPYYTVLDTSDWSVVTGTPSLGGTTGWGVAYSHDGAHIAVAHTGAPYVSVIDTSNWSVVSGTPTLANTGRGVAFSGNGFLAVAHDGDPRVTIIDTSDWSVVSGTPVLAGNGQGVSFSPDGSQLAVVHFGLPLLTVLNTSDWSVVSGTQTLVDTGYGVSYSPDGRFLGVAHVVSPNFSVYRTFDWSYVEGAASATGTGRGIAFSPDSKQLAVAHHISPRFTVVNTGEAIVWWNGTNWSFNEVFLASTQESYQFPGGAWAGLDGEMAWSVATRGVYTGPYAELFTFTLLERVSPDAPTLLQPPNESDFAPNSNPFTWDFNPSAEFLEDEQTEAALRWDRVVPSTDWEKEPGTPTLSGGGSTDYQGNAAYSPDGAYLAIAHVGGARLTVLDTSDWSVVSGTPSLSGDGYDVEFSPDGSFLAVAHIGGARLTVIDTLDWSTVPGTPTLPGTAWGLGFSKDGSLLAVGHDESPCITVIDTLDFSVVTGGPSESPGGSGQGGRDVVFTHDGQFLIVVFWTTPRCAFYATSDWSTHATVNLGSSVLRVDVSPDDTLCAVARQGSNYDVFNCASPDPSEWFYEGTPNLGFVHDDVVFSPDGIYLVVGSSTSPGATFVAVSDWSVVANTVVVDSRVRGLAFSPDSLSLAAVENESPYLAVINRLELQDIEPRWWNGSEWVLVETFIPLTDGSYQFPPGAWDD